jgi:hypothetical protein
MKNSVMPLVRHLLKLIPKNYAKKEQSVAGGPVSLRVVIPGRNCRLNL